MATLITPYGQEFAVTPQDFEAGFTKPEIDQFIQGDGKAFRLPTGELLLVNALACADQMGQSNLMATCLLRRASADPGGEVWGWALFLNPAESARLSPSVQTALHLDSTDQTPMAMLLEHNEEFRSFLAQGLERQKFRVVQARTAAEAVALCRTHSLHLLIADVSSLGLKPLETRQLIQALQPTAELLLISGFTEYMVAERRPGLLTGIPFLQKPFRLNALANVVHCVARTDQSTQHIHLLAEGKTDSPG